MADRVRGTVINIHNHGATVRLEDASLAAVPAGDVAANRPAYVASLQRREPLDFRLERAGRHPVVVLDAAALGQRERAEAPALADPAFEARMDAYHKATQEWMPADCAPPAERHFIRKKRRAAFFEARTKPT
jgi:hypothetical protein